MWSVRRPFCQASVGWTDVLAPIWWMLCDSSGVHFPNTVVWEVKCQLLTASMTDICLPAPFHLCQWQTCLICIYAATICLWTFRCSMFCAQRIWITAHTSFLVHHFSSSAGSPFSNWHCTDTVFLALVRISAAYQRDHVPTCDRGTACYNNLFHRII
jgi:hypothetical protein